MFVSTQPLLLKYNDENQSFRENMKQNMETLVNIYNNQDISYSELIQKLKLKKLNNGFIYQPYVDNENNFNENVFLLNEYSDLIVKNEELNMKQIA
eukprot:jgi/Orpsp1_1/1175534/evm.model.c7180000054226.1